MKLEAGYRQVTDTFTAALRQLERLYLLHWKVGENLLQLGSGADQKDDICL